MKTLLILVERLHKAQLCRPYIKTCKSHVNVARLAPHQDKKYPQQILDKVSLSGVFMKQRSLPNQVLPRGVAQFESAQRQISINGCWKVIVIFSHSTAQSPYRRPLVMTFSLLNWTFIQKKGGCGYPSNWFNDNQRLDNLLLSLELLLVTPAVPVMCHVWYCQPVITS